MEPVMEVGHQEPLVLASLFAFRVSPCLQLLHDSTAIPISRWDSETSLRQWAKNKPNLVWVSLIIVLKKLIYDLNTRNNECWKWLIFKLHDITGSIICYITMIKLNSFFNYLMKKSVQTDHNCTYSAHSGERDLSKKEKIQFTLRM